MYTRTQCQFVAKRAVLSALWVGVALLYALGWTSPAAASQVDGLQTPQSFLADPSGEFYFISNVNGEADAKDNNGFITKLDKAGKITDLHFIQGGQNGTTLNGPKGMAIVDRLLYVVDVDTLRGFDKGTGRTAVIISLEERLAGSTHRPIALTDVAYDGNGALYLSDTEADTIYRVDIAQQHAVSILAKTSALAGPAGLATSAELRRRMPSMLEEIQAGYPVPRGEAGAWWLPARLGGSAPSPEQAAALDAARPEAEAG